MVSIIVPCYNSEKYIDRCVRSLLSQIYHDIEVVLVDDGSKDGTPKILDDLGSCDKRIKVIHQENSGASSARNKGVECVSGEYLCFVDSDDYVTDEYVSSMVKTIESDSVDLVLSGRELHYRSGTNETFTPIYKILRDEGVREFFYEKSYKLVRGGPVGKLFKTSIIKEHNITFPIGIHYLEDAIFVLDYLLCSKSLASIPVTSYHYDLHADSLVYTIHDFDTETLGYNSFKKVARSCEDKYNLKESKGWIVDNLMFLIHRQIKAANNDCEKLNYIDWDYFKHHLKNSSLSGKLWTSLICNKFSRNMIVKFGLMR